jgi:hypothetical protein
MINKKFIYNIAKKVRVISEITVCDEVFCKNDWYEQTTLCFFCGVASSFLNKKLNDNNIKSHIIYGQCAEGKKFTDFDRKLGLIENHCWIMLDNYIIDISATQFKWGENLPIIISTSKEIAKYYIAGVEPDFNNWPKEQRPNKDVLEYMEKLYA